MITRIFFISNPGFDMLGKLLKKKFALKVVGKLLSKTK